jgi:dihydrofolate reductase
MSFDIVVAADLDWGIGKDNALPWPRLKADLAHFRKTTSEAPDGKRNAIVMGRKTWASAEVAGKPLPRRWNVVVSRAGTPAVDGVLIAPSLDAALIATAAAEDIATTYVVGGAQLIVLALADARLRWVYLTRVAGRFGCDTHLPDLDAAGFRADAAWPAADHEDNGVRFRIERLSR